MQYVLLLKDDFSSYCWLIPCPRACSDEAAKAISSWIRTFTVMRMWVSDQGSHFKNDVLHTLASEYGIKHNFTIAYSPWANGTVERLCREVLRTVRSFLSELKLAERDWPAVIKDVQAAINDAPVRRLGSRGDGTLRTPLEIMTGIRPVRHPRAIKPAVTSAASPEILTNLQDALVEVHKDVKLRCEKERQRQRKAHNKKTNVYAANFCVGDFVMVRRAQNKGHKLASKWIGPLEITTVISDSAYDVQNLITGKRETVHHTLLRHVSSNIGANAEKYQAHAEHTESIYETVEELMQSKHHRGQLYIQVRWSRSDGSDDITWQPFGELFEDVLDMLQEYAHRTADRHVLEELKAHVLPSDHTETSA